MRGAADAWGRTVLGRVVRRTLTISALAVFVLVAVLVTLAWVLVLPFRLLPRVRFGRLDRVIAMAGTYLAAESVGLVLALVLWLRALAGRWGPERVQEETYRLLGALLRILRSASEKFAGLRVVSVGVEPGQPGRSELPSGPLIVASRHGGPGGAFLLAEILINRYERRPRIVLRAVLRLDPLLDVLLGRVPHRFIHPRPGDGGATAATVGDLATGMGPDDVLLIFPEGGNVSPERRRRALARLRRRQSAEHVRRAEQLRHTLPPHPDGLFQALDAAPEATMVFVAHTGLDHGSSVGEAWRAVPLPDPVRFTSWETPVAGVPREAEARLRWLEGNWAEMDRWVGRTRTVEIGDAPAVT